MPTIEEARALQPGALLRVNDDLTADPEHYGVADIVLLHGYIYHFGNGFNHWPAFGLR